VTLEPGTYVLKGGQIKLGGNGSLTGAGVTIFLTEGASISIGANETVNLTPPTGGAYAGVTIYQARGNDQALTLLGTSDSLLTGMVYAPSAHVQFAGNGGTSGSGECVRLVGATIEMTGNSSFSTDCRSVFGDKEMTAGQNLALVR